ncbi:hypothetical protein, conserved [Eimeria tenella]|uniref:Uncharacterized protein n=1 Tax=Eimeria tenella TaxID=5802 RepID=U6KRZ8_EIMTE|nr:hypothetical protein, conserved [Eimeria tenella]CDJ40746.1 hypothetical protein, conserved [Eimeria tenella]|eukprot:XP_013231496.1 hypothetical protein, conserved [Eimeria tenella]
MAAAADALYFLKECDSVTGELQRLLGAGGLRSLNNFLSFSLGKQTRSEISAISPYKGPSRAAAAAAAAAAGPQACPGCAASSSSRKEALEEAAVACYKLEGLCVYLEVHAEEIRAAAALHAAAARATTAPAARPRVAAAAATAATAPRAAAAIGPKLGSYQRAVSVKIPLAAPRVAAPSSSSSSSSTNSSGSSSSSRQGLRVRRAETEVVRGGLFKELSRGEPGSSSTRKSAAAAEQQQQQLMQQQLMQQQLMHQQQQQGLSGALLLPAPSLRRGGDTG